MSFNFRTKLSMLVGAIALGFLVLVTANVLIANRVEKQLKTIHDYYIPLIKLGPHLESQFERIMRSLQDAVSANDSEAFDSIDQMNRNLLNELERSAGVLYPENPARITPLASALSDMYDTARSISLRLMREETGTSIADALNAMQTKYAQVRTMLQEATLFDESKLTEAFTSVDQAQKTAERLQLWISISCLLLIIGLSTGIVRSMLRALDSLTAGLMRFSEGDFDSPVPVLRHDELGEVAETANRMAKQIQTLMAALKATNQELESFSYSVAHDLRAPLRAATGFSRALLEDYSSILPADARTMVNHISIASKKMRDLIDGLLNLSRVTRGEMTIETVDLSSIAQDILQTLRQGDPERKVEATIERGVMACGDPRLLRVVLANLIGNAWKFTGKTPNPKIEFGKTEENGRAVFFVRDNGAGFDMNYSEKLFNAFQRLHSDSEFEGTGIGLATVQRIVHRHHGNIWARSEPGKGATFFFYLGE